MDIHWSTPAWMWPLLLVVAAGAIVFTVAVYRRSRPLPAPVLRRSLILLRSTAVVLLVLAIAGPVISRLVRRQEPAQLVVVFEDSASMAIGDAGPSGEVDAAEAETRWDRSLDLAARLDSLAAGLDDPVELVLLRGNGLDPVREFALTDPVVLPPSAHGTDLGRLLTSVGARLVGRPVRSVVLVADGQETSQWGRTGAVQRKPDRRPAAGGATWSFGPDVDLAVVGVGDPLGPADRILKDLRYPDTAFQGDEVVVEIAVSHRFTHQQTLPPVTATLRDGAGRVVVETTVPAIGDLARLELSFVPDTAGLQVYHLEISGLDNERFPENNQASLAINVAKERSRVLVLADRPGWDVRFLALAAHTEQRLDLSVVYPTPEGLVLADSLTSWSPPVMAESWLAYDGVVLTGWTGALAGLDWTSLTEAVEQGLGLLVLPGPSVTGELGRSQPPPRALIDLLPVVSPDWRWTAGAFRLSAPAQALGHPLLDGGAVTGIRSGSELDHLPPLRLLVPVVPKPEALVLLQALRPVEDKETVAGAALVADVRGKGRVLFFAGRRLWELAFWEPGVWQGGLDIEQPARRLTRNLLVWTASGDREAGLALVGRRAFFQVGERIRLAARWRDMRGQPVTGRRPVLTVRRTEAAGDSLDASTYPMLWSGLEAGLAEVELPPLPAGNYLVQLVGPGEPLVTGREEIMVITSYNVEQTQVRLDQQRLRQLAAAAGGTYYRGRRGQPDGESKLLAKLAELTWRGAQHERRSRLDFWSGWPFLVLVVIPLSVEWWLRRRHGLL